MNNKKSQPISPVDNWREKIVKSMFAELESLRLAKNAESQLPDRRNPYLLDRRKDTSMTDTVQRGSDLYRMAGDVAAIAYMLRMEIPFHVALRVLAGSAFRRHPGRSTLRASAGVAAGLKQTAKVKR